MILIATFSRNIIIFKYFDIYLFVNTIEFVKFIKFVKFVKFIKFVKFLKQIESRIRYNNVRLCL